MCAKLLTDKCLCIDTVHCTALDINYVSVVSEFVGWWCCMLLSESQRNGAAIQNEFEDDIGEIE